MAWTAPFTYTVSQVLTAGNLNTYLSANMQFLATPPICTVYRATALTLTDATPTTIPYDTVVVDSVSGFDLSTHKYDVQVAGSYLVTASLGVASASGQQLFARVLLTGTDQANDGQALEDLGT